MGEMVSVEVEIETKIVIDLCNVTVGVLLNEECDSTIPLLGLIESDIEYLRDGGIAQYADKDDWNISDLKKCAKLINDLIKDIEALYGWAANIAFIPHRSDPLKRRGKSLKSSKSYRRKNQNEQTFIRYSGHTDSVRVRHSQDERHNAGRFAAYARYGENCHHPR